METAQHQQELDPGQAPALEVAVNNTQKAKSFIEANTVEASLQEIKDSHIIPVFHRDNNTVISQADFIETTLEVARSYFPGERFSTPLFGFPIPLWAESRKPRISR